MAKRQRFYIRDLSGGLNPDRNDTLIADNEATIVENIRFDKVGSIISRDGYTPYYDADPGADIQTIGRWSPGDNPAASHVLIKLADGTIRRVIEATSYTTLHSGLDTAAAGEFEASEDILFYVDGVDIPVIYDGSTVHEAGIDAPGSAPALTLVAGGLGSGSEQYTYAYTFYDSATDTESNPSPSASETPSSSQDIQLTLPGSHARADKVRIYRTEPDGALLFFLAEVGIATATYTDSGAVALDLTDGLEYDNDPPLAYEHTAFHKGYQFASIGDVLYWSKPFDPEHWPALNFTQVPFEGNDEIVAMQSYQDTLVVFGRRNVIVVAGSGGQWALTRLDVPIGAVNDRSVIEVDGSLVYLSYDGLRTFPRGEPIAPYLDRVISALARTSVDDAAMAHVPEERSIWVSLGGKTYTVHIPNRALSVYSFTSPGFLTGGPTGFDKPLFISSGLRRVHEYGADNDEGANIFMRWTSKTFTLERPEMVKFFRRLGAFASIGSQDTVNVAFAADNSLAPFTVTLTGTSALTLPDWDAELWDDFSWASEGLVWQVAALPAHILSGNTFQVTITADAPRPTEIVGPITLEYREADRFLGQ